MKNGLTVSEIAEDESCDRASVVKWLKLEGVKPVATKKFGKRTFQYFGSDAVKVVKSHCKRVASRNGESNIDPESKLTWAQLSLKEKAIATQRENERARRLEADEIMLTTRHHQILSAVMGRIEQVPGKVKSEAGLDDRQFAVLCREIDNARSAAAVEVEGMK